MKKEELIKFKDIKLTGEEASLIDETIDKSIMYMSEANPDKPVGFMNLIIAVEELSELQQAVTKTLRGKKDQLNLIEEIADVELCMEYIRRCCNVSKDEVEKMKRLKAERLLKKINNGNFK